MLTERARRQIERLLDEADEAIKERNWSRVQACAQDVLALDPENADAEAYRVAAQRALDDASNGQSQRASPFTAVATASQADPISFVSGRYEVVRLLGEGATKRVYLAHDVKLDRDVAFALIKTEGLDAGGLTRIRREAQAMARLGDHPNIVAVYDIGDEGGEPYIVSQFMAGGDLQQLIEQAPDHRIPLEQATKIAEQVCEALQHAHAEGVIHRDLKPGNVWLSGGLASGLGDEEPSAGESRPTPKPQTLTPTAKLGDFGLAIALDRSRLTQAGMMVGTVAYMAPEQALGGEVTAGSDLYSLGCLLYELVTGRPPFVGDESVAIIGQHLNTPPVAPSWHRPGLSAGLEALILRLLEKDPAKRPASAGEVRQALAGIGGQESGIGSSATAAESTLTPDTQPPTPAADPVYRTTFVGRENEVRQLRAAFDAAISGQGALTMVAGEPGIGKTALCEQLAIYAVLRGGKTLVGHCYEEGSLSLPYLPFVEGLRSYVMDREPELLREDLGTGAAEVARIISEVRDRVAVEPPPTGDPEDDRWRLFQAVTAFLRNAASVQPLLLVLEDLHWADRGTLDYLVHLNRNLGGVRLLVVGTYRDVEVDRSHPLSNTLAELRREGGFQRVPLRGLTIDEVQRMMNSIRGQEVSWGRAEAIHRQTEGNPLFVQEVLRYLVEEGLVVREGGRYVRTDGAEPEAGIPEGLREVIGKRLNRLSPETNRVLSFAAVIGRDFDLDTVRSLAELEDERLLGCLDEAVRVSVLEERAQVGGVRYRFAHAFFRQTLYEELGAARRIRLHQQVGRALEELYRSRVSDHAAELAEHFAHSSDREDLAKAVGYGEAAAQRAMSVFDYGEAVRLLERALDVQEVLDPDDKAKRCDLLLALGAALSPAGEPLRAAEEIAEEAFALAEALGDAKRAFACCRVAMDAAVRYGAATMLTTPLGARWLERGEHYSAPGTAERARTLAFQAPARFGEGRWAEAWFLREEALVIGRRCDDPETLFLAAAEMLDGPSAPRFWQARVQIARDFPHRSPAGVSTRTLTFLLFHSGRVLLADGLREEAEAAWRQMEQVAARTQDPFSLTRSLVPEIVTGTLDGRLEEAVEAAHRLVVRSDELGSAIFGLQFAGLQTQALLYLGRAEEALSLVGLAARSAGVGERPIAVVSRVLCLAHAGRANEALHLLPQLTEMLISAPIAEAPVAFSLTALEVALLENDLPTAALLSEHLADFAPFLSDFNPTSIARHLGAAAALLNEPEKATAYYYQAIEVCERVRFRPELALTRFQLAELLLDHYPNERVEAIEHLDFAITEFEAMKMAPSLERALALRERAQA